jgi:hypothetical protein
MGCYWYEKLAFMSSFEILIEFFTACELIAAILLSGSAVCLRSEREKEEQLNLQYLMPVYPQKQPAYGYPYPQAQIYPGPYYHGSQYGPYNY